MSKRTKAPEKDKDELEEGTMSFLDHLDELRKRLIRSALFVICSFVICWFFSGYIYKFLQVPVLAAMVEAASKVHKPGVAGKPQVASLWDFLDKDCDFTFPTNTKIDTDNGKALVQAGTTIKVRPKQAEDGALDLITVSPWILNVNVVLQEGSPIPRELFAASNVLLNPENRLVVGTVQGAFNLYIKVSFYAALFFAVPFLLSQAWGFIAPGLYAHEKKYAIPVILMASVFFLLGSAFAYYIAFPRAASFLLDVAVEGDLRPLVTADDYFDLIILIMLGLGAVFEIPTITFVGARLGLITHKMLYRWWRYAIIVIFIAAAFLSPTTDVPNLLVFAVPMMVLYFGSIGIAWLFHRKRKTEQEYSALARKEA
jgi:sec-independent protein translocase protein TatC